MAAAVHDDHGTLSPVRVEKSTIIECSRGEIDPSSPRRGPDGLPFGKSRKDGADHVAQGIPAIHSTGLWAPSGDPIQAGRKKRKLFARVHQDVRSNLQNESLVFVGRDAPDQYDWRSTRLSANRPFACVLSGDLRVAGPRAPRKWSSVPTPRSRCGFTPRISCDRPLQTPKKERSRDRQGRGCCRVANGPEMSGRVLAVASTGVVRLPRRPPVQAGRGTGRVGLEAALRRRNEQSSSANPEAAIP